MAFVKCPHCGKQYTDRISTCPFCKRGKQNDSTKLEQQTNKTNQISPATSILAFVVAAITLIIISYNSGYFKLPSSNKPLIVDAKELYRQFKKNEIAAAEKYSGNKAIISGEYVGNGISSGDPWILIGRGIVAADVQCYLDKESVKKAANLKVGQNIRAKGIVDKIMFTSVIVENCKL